MNRVFRSVLVAGLCLTHFACSPSIHSSVSADESKYFPPIDYSQMSATDALKTKYELMKPYVRNQPEAEILRVVYEGLSEAKAKGKYKDVNMEDMMAHALQEAMMMIGRLASGQPMPSNAKGTTLWDIRMTPGNDLLGNVSWSVWQTITQNYLVYGREFNPELEKIYQRSIVKYGLEIAQKVSGADATQVQISKATSLYKKTIREVEGTEKGDAIINQIEDDVGAVISKDPRLHTLATAALIQGNYDWLGVRDPFAVRAYYWYDYQKNLLPGSWLGPVHDHDISKRGDYGKQVTLGNSYNDRGMIFWYTVTRDKAALDAINAQWATDPAKIVKADAQTMKANGYVKFPDAIYNAILANLPE